MRQIVARAAAPAIVVATAGPGKACFHTDSLGDRYRNPVSFDGAGLVGLRVLPSRHTRTEGGRRQLIETRPRRRAALRQGPGVIHEQIAGAAGVVACRSHERCELAERFFVGTDRECRSKSDRVSWSFVLRTLFAGGSAPISKEPSGMTTIRGQVGQSRNVVPEGCTCVSCAGSANGWPVGALTVLGRLIVGERLLGGPSCDWRETRNWRSRSRVGNGTRVQASSDQVVFHRETDYHRHPRGFGTDAAIRGRIENKVRAGTRAFTVSTAARAAGCLAPWPGSPL